MRLHAALGTFVLLSVVVLNSQPAPALRIVVLEGEGAVNIIQQKTAVRPLVEVRDRNNLPVAGATVTFSIGGGGSGAAFAGGAQTLTVTTNAVGQAAASGLNAISSGALQIQVQAAYQGQIATAAISQTNFATAAAAAQAGAGAGTGGGSASGAAGGAAGGGGGGLSATTIGIVGAAVAGGAVAATQVAGGDSDEETFDSYRGAYNTSFVFTSTQTNPQGGSTFCSFTMAATGEVTIELVNGTSSGRAAFSMQYGPTSISGPCTTSPQSGFTFQRENTPVSGGPNALTFTGTANIGAVAHNVVFTGALAGNNINGTISMTTSSTGPPNYVGSTSFPVTLVGPRP